MRDLEALLEGISEKSPAGEDLRLSSTDASLTELRRRLRQLGPNHGGGSAADWQALGRECEDVLRTRSKDLEVAAYLAIAWTQQQGFDGLADSLQLILGLCDRYWAHLNPGVVHSASAAEPAYTEGSAHPEGNADAAGDSDPESGPSNAVDLDLREHALQLLCGTELLRAISRSALLDTPWRDRPLTWEEYEFTERVDEYSGAAKFKAKYDELRAAGWVGSDEWCEDLRRAGPDALRTGCDRIRRSLDALSELQTTLAKLWGAEDPPRFIALADRLHEMLERLEPEQVDVSGGEAVEGSDSLSSESVAPTNGPLQASPIPMGPTQVPQIQLAQIRNREDALRLLELVGRYFRENEPHSPLASICTRAVRWGRMPFEEVLREVLEDEKVLAKLWNAVGVREGSSS